MRHLARELRVVAFGGRGFSDRLFAFHMLDCFAAAVLHPGDTLIVIEGGARGADRTGRDWAFSRGHRVWTFPAEWNSLGRGAGFARNQRMIDVGRPHGAIAFPGGSGTADMTRRVRVAQIPLWEIT